MKKRKKMKNNTSGIQGVAYYEVNHIGYWAALWSEDGTPKKKTFSCKRFGEEDARLQAIAYRKTKEEELYNDEQK